MGKECKARYTSEGTGGHEGVRGKESESLLGRDATAGGTPGDVLPGRGAGGDDMRGWFASQLPTEQMNGFNVLPCLGSGRQKLCVGWEGEAGKHDSEVYRHSAVTSGFQCSA
eukprot:EG_transcript_60525